MNTLFVGNVGRWLLVFVIAATLAGSNVGNWSVDEAELGDIPVLADGGQSEIGGG